MIIIFFSIPIVFLALYLTVAYRTMKRIQKFENSERKICGEKLQCRFNHSIRNYKNVQDYYSIRNNIKYP